MKKMVFGFVVIFALVIAAYCFFYAPTTQMTKIKSYGVPSGYVQTPRGGAPGSSDVERPTFSELGVKPSAILSYAHLWKSPLLTVSSGHQFIRLQGETSVKRSLKTYGFLIPAKTSLKSKTRFDWYWLGAGLPLHWNDWRFSPYLGLSLLDFSYYFQTPSLHAERAYHHVTLRKGFSFEYPLIDNISLVLFRAESLPLFRELDIRDWLMGIKIKTSQGEDFIGLQRIRINYQDKQAMPNHLFLDTGVMHVNA
jgi:hypothetical protein